MTDSDQADIWLAQCEEEQARRAMIREPIRAIEAGVVQGRVWRIDRLVSHDGGIPTFPAYRLAMATLVDGLEEARRRNA